MAESAVDQYRLFLWHGWALVDDLRFLLIGPMFVLNFFYRRFHIAY